MRKIIRAIGALLILVSWTLKVLMVPFVIFIIIDIALSIPSPTLPDSIYKKLGLEVNILHTFVVSLLCLAARVVGLYIYRFGRRLTQLTVKEKLARDTRVPIFLLRSFTRDSQVIHPNDATSPSLKPDENELKGDLFARPFVRFGSSIKLGLDLLNFTPKNIEFEEFLVHELETFGPVITLGRPGEFLPPIGAARYYVGADKDWKQVVLRFSQYASPIVFVLDFTESVLWELQAMASYASLKRLILVLPPRRSAEWHNKWEHTRHQLKFLPQIHPDTAVVRYDGAGRCRLYEAIPTTFDDVDTASATGTVMALGAALRDMPLPLPRKRAHHPSA